MIPLSCVRAMFEATSLSLTSATPSAVEVKYSSRRWPEPGRAYRAWYRERASNDSGLGAVQFVRVEPDTWVANTTGLCICHEAAVVWPEASGRRWSR